MSLSLSMRPDLRCRLQMLHVKPKNTVLVIGCLRNEEGCLPDDTDYITHFERKAEELRSLGIHTFIFAWWNTFEHVFLQALLNTRKKADRYLLVGEGIDPDCLSPEHPFEEILFADDLYCEGDKDLFDNLFSFCNMVAAYRVKDIIPHENIVGRAARRRKIIFTMEGSASLR